MTTVFIGIGSNLGDRRVNLQTAVRMLTPSTNPVRFSSIYQTPPWGYKDQPAFYNCVVEATTQLSPRILLAVLKGIEEQMGRIPSVRYGPRLIDLDILLYANRVIQLPDLEIPHPRMAERAFVLVPLVEIAGELHHPLTGKTMTELLSLVDTTGVMRIGPLFEGEK